MKTVLNLIGGERLPAMSGEILEDHNPATQELLAEIPRSGATDVSLAVSAARNAMSGTWGSTTTEARAQLLEDIADAIEARSAELAELVSIPSFAACLAGMGVLSMADFGENVDMEEDHA